MSSSRPAPTADLNDESKDNMKIATSKGVETVVAVTSEYQSSLLAPDIINVVRGLRLNNLRVPKWLALEYNAIEMRHISMPVVPQVQRNPQSTTAFESS